MYIFRVDWTQTQFLLGFPKIAFLALLENVLGSPLFNFSSDSFLS